MPRRRSRAALATVTVGVVAAAGLVAQPLPAEARPNPESAFLLPVIAPDGTPLVEAGLPVWCSPGSRYRFAAGQLVTVSGLFLHSRGSQPPPWPELRVPRRVTPGAPLRVSVASAVPLADLTVTVELVGGGSVAGRGFAVDAGSPGGSWAALLGMPSTAVEGVGQLLVAGHSGGDGAPVTMRLLLALPLSIGSRTFAEEEIPLNPELTLLRRAPDPRRVEQSRELWRLLSSWRPDAQRHLGALQLPLAEVRRSAGFGDRRRYRYDDGSVAVSIHNGIDFAAPEGTRVAAAGSGTVVLARERIVTGLSVAIEHLPGVYSLYYHLARIVVREGQRVSAGAAVGTGSTSRPPRERGSPPPAVAPWCWPASAS